MQIIELRESREKGRGENLAGESARGRDNNFGRRCASAQSIIKRLSIHYYDEVDYHFTEYVS